ncbi:tetratricopeptide repeat protein [Flavobacteriaceae bacterium TP-CH-4]|uniref:Tetratricopeptide repeat protein n=1 Tax=Pelagihabitans pacificus TaxID=2696054 RepID=A0A967B1M1_9FLAO|nr:tetratricopeptide repeat protein [Pelagihabitans pacificus]NHF61452.1 tetratricopeptide repeat protein [Pelagihabitans pacificus]
MDKETLIYRYFANELDKEGEAVLNQLLDSDTEFRKRFEFEKSLKKVIRHKKGEDLKAKLNSFEVDIAKKSPSSKPKGGFRNWSIAASIALLIGLGWVGFNTFLGTSSDALYEEHFRAYPNTVYTITRGDTDDSLERKAFVAYESGDYESAIDYLEELKGEENKAYIAFYMAQSHLNLGNTEAALALFQQIMDSEKEFEAEAHWYTALAHLKNGDKENATRYLQKLTAGFDYNRERAEALLQKID